MNYQTALKTLNGRKSSKIGNHTYLLALDNGNVAIQLHWTHVITITPDNKYILNSGGYRTATTKNRINQYAPVNLCQKKGVWYVGDVEYFDGMEV